MRAEHEKYHQIERFLRGELKAEELDAFKNKLSNDPGFADEVAYQQEVNELISANSYHELRQQMSKDIVDLDKQTSLKKWLGRGLILAAVVFTVGYFMLTNKNQEKQILVEKNKTMLSDNAAPEHKAEKEIENIDKPSSISNNNYTTANIAKEEEKEEVREPEVKIIINEENGKEDASPEEAKVPSAKVKENLSLNIEPKISSADSDKVIIDPCSKVTIVAQWNAKSACSNQNDGRIEVEKSTIMGGKGPYSLSLVHEGTNNREPFFDRLYSGLYRLKVTDVNGCSGAWNIRVEEQVCRSKDISISPGYGEKWEYNGIDGDSYYLSIYNQAGQLVYKSPFLTGTTEWTGATNSGSTVETGLYIYIVEYTSGRKENGQITVIQ